MKKIIIGAMIGIMLLSAVSHAYQEGEMMACGKIYHKEMLRSDTTTNFALHKPSRIGGDATGASNNGSGVGRTY